VQRGAHFDTPGASEAGDQIGVLGAQRRDNTTGRADAQAIGGWFDARLQGDEPTQELGS